MEQAKQSGCECRKDIESRLTERFVGQAPQATEHKVTLQGYAYILGATVSERPYMEYKATAVHPLKKGGTKAKSETGSMLFNFCPFCGVKLDTGAAS